MVAWETNGGRKGFHFFSPFFSLLFFILGLYPLSVFLSKLSSFSSPSSSSSSFSVSSLNQIIFFFFPSFSPRIAFGLPLPCAVCLDYALILLLAYMKAVELKQYSFFLSLVPALHCSFSTVILPFFFLLHVLHERRKQLDNNSFSFHVFNLQVGFLMRNTNQEGDYQRLG